MTHASTQAADRTAYEIHHLLVLTTAHLTQTDAELIAAQDFPGKGGDAESLLVFVADDEGAAAGAAAKGYSDAFVAALRLARRLGCRFVLFDRDGPAVDELPLHEW